MKSISSRQNPWFKRVRDAVREHAEEIAIEGPEAVEDAIAAGWQPIIVVEVSEELRRAVADTKTSQGVFGLFHRPPSRFAADRIVAALDGVQDPGNVGTIVRLAAAFDAGVALLPGCAAPFAPKAIREHGTPIGITTSGRVESLNVAAAAAILLWQSFR